MGRMRDIGQESFDVSGNLWRMSTKYIMNMEDDTICSGLGERF